MLSIRLTDEGATPRLLQREQNKIHRAAAHAMAAYWDTELKPKHFTNAGASEYGYTPRKGERGRPDPKGFSKSYTGRKLRKYGHTKPLTLTGQTKAFMKTRIVSSATSKESKGRVIINAPGLNRRYKNSPIDMRDEMTRISPAEATEMAEIAEAEIQRGYAEVAGRSSTTIS